MQPTIHLQSKPRCRRGEYAGLLCKCIVGCIVNSVWLITVLFWSQYFFLIKLNNYISKILCLNHLCYFCKLLLKLTTLLAALTMKMIRAIGFTLAKKY
jgi:hypothetical protein